MQSESQIPTASQGASSRFATRVALFYGTLFGMTGTHLPFFTVWLKAVGIDAFWIGLITAVPPVTRFTVLPLVTGLAERRQALRGGIIVTAFATALGFFILGTQHLPVLVFLIYAMTCCLWTPMVPLTDAYALRGREALWPQLRTVAAVGLGRLRARRAGLRGAVRPHRRPKSDLDHRRLRRDRGAGQPRAAAAGRHQDGPPGHRRRQRVAARRRLYRCYRGVGADPGQPCRLLHFRVDCLATGRVTTG